MTKADLARAVYERHGGISLEDSHRIVDEIFAIIKQQLLDGNRLSSANIKNLAARPRNLSRPQIRPHHLAHVNKIAGLLAIAKDGRGLAA